MEAVKPATGMILRARPMYRHNVEGKFDTAQTTADMRRHWANADGLSANAAASPVVRRTLRNRARYEVANNSYARGIVLTLANDVIGTGPRLQMLTDNAELNRRIEQRFAEWSQAVDLAGKLRTMRMARAQDGEAFALLMTNAGLMILEEDDKVVIDGLTWDSKLKHLEKLFTMGDLDNPLVIDKVMVKNERMPKV